MTRMHWRLPAAALLAAATVEGTALMKAHGQETEAPYPPERDITVACYYFGNYHPGDPRNDKLKGKGWTEWDLVGKARPRFPGHRQPNIPLWGNTDESDPMVMAKKIDAAAHHGIDAFIFDWYYYDDGPFLDRPIDEGFLKARNNDRIKFAFMWANHDWIDIHPYRRGSPQKLLYPGQVTPATFETIGDHVVGRYFQHPSYWCIDGKPYFSFYDLTKLLESFGSVEATRSALDRLRTKATAAGLPGLHLNAVVWGRTILPVEKTPADPGRLVHDLGFDSVTSYVWIHHVGLPEQVTDYNWVRDSYFKYWTRADQTFDVPYFPNVTMGWDSSPRAAQEDAFDNVGYPFMNTIGNNTPVNFRKALALTRQRLLAEPDGPRVLTINCWNEWTEGSYLEPDTINGMKYLEAVREVFDPALTPRAYLFSYFTGNGDDGLHLAAGADGFKWEALKGGKSFLAPAVGGKLMRDPCVTRGPDGVFHMVWTTGWFEQGIGLAHSRDLVNWSKQEWLPVMAHESEARNCWAPEIVYDPESARFVIYWSTTITGQFTETEEKDGDKLRGGGVCNHRIYYTTTQDFKTYGPTALLYDPGFNCIDATIVPANGRWLMFIKDETKAPVARKNIRMAWADSPTGPWGPAGTPISPDWVEGPTVILMGDTWMLYYDAYTRHRFEGLASTDLKSWQPIDARIAFPKGARHGTVFAVPSEILKLLQQQ